VRVSQWRDGDGDGVIRAVALDGKVGAAGFGLGSRARVCGGNGRGEQGGQTPIYGDANWYTAAWEVWEAVRISMDRLSEFLISIQGPDVARA
jgi:hypothetical protein